MREAARSSPTPSSSASAATISGSNCVPEQRVELGDRLVVGEPAAVDTVRGHRVVRVGDEDDPGAERDVVPADPIRIAGAVPALVVVQHPVGDRVDAEALEHAEADLRVALEHEPLGLGERAGLAQDLLGDRELAEVVQAAGEACQLDLLAIDPEPGRDPGRKIGDPLGVRAGVGVACVDRSGEAGCRAEARRPVGPGGEPLQLGDLDHVGPVDAHLVLAVLLGPVESAVRAPDELVAAQLVLRARSRCRR